MSVSWWDREYMFLPWSWPKKQTRVPTKSDKLLLSGNKYPARKITIKRLANTYWVQRERKIHISAFDISQKSSGWVISSVADVINSTEDLPLDWWGSTFSIQANALPHWDATWLFQNEPQSRRMPWRAATHPNCWTIEIEFSVFLEIKLSIFVEIEFFIIHPTHFLKSISTDFLEFNP